MKRDVICFTIDFPHNKSAFDYCFFNYTDLYGICDQQSAFFRRGENLYFSSIYRWIFNSNDDFCFVVALFFTTFSKSNRGIGS